MFIGEIKGGEVSGFHDWVHFYQQEKDNEINYLGYLEQTDFNGVTLLSEYKWENICSIYGLYKYMIINFDKQFWLLT